MKHFPPEIISWLLAGDPAIRWQVMRDLLHTGEAEYTDERSRIANEGWGKMLLDRQDAANLITGKRKADGTWLLQGRHAGSTYFEMEQPGKPSRWNTLRGLSILQWMEL